MMAATFPQNGLNKLANGSLSHVKRENNYVLKEEPKDEYSVQNETQVSRVVSDLVKSEQVEEQDVSEEQTEEPTLDITINNVVCSFSVRCHLNLRQIALQGSNVEFRRENGMVTMKLRSPYTTASIWSSGKVTCTGATSESEAKRGARRYARVLQKLGFRVHFCHFRIVNVLGTCTMPFAIKITQFSQQHRKTASYEPELHPGVTYKMKDLRATLKIFSTGSITVTAPSVLAVQQAIEHIYPLVCEFRKERIVGDEANPSLFPHKARKKVPLRNTHVEEEDDDEEEDVDDDLEEDLDSDQSMD